MFSHSAWWIHSAVPATLLHLDHYQPEIWSQQDIWEKRTNYQNSNSNINNSSSNVKISDSNCPDVNPNDLVDCRCQYPGEDLNNINQHLISTQEYTASTSKEGFFAGKPQLGSRRTSARVKRGHNRIANRGGTNNTNTLACTSKIPDCSTCKNGTDGIAVLPPTHAVCQQVQFVCPGEVTTGPIWTHKCSRGIQIKRDNSRHLEANVSSQSRGGSSTKMIKLIAQSRQSCSLITIKWNSKSSNGSRKLRVCGYGHKRHSHSIVSTPSGIMVQNHTAKVSIKTNCNDGTCPNIILPAYHPQCLGYNVHDQGIVGTFTPVPAENQQAPPSFATGSPSLNSFSLAPNNPSIMVNAPVSVQSQPTVTLPVTNSGSAQGDSVTTSAPSQIWISYCAPDTPQTLSPSLEPSGIQLAPPSFVSGSQSVDLVPLSPTLPTILATAPVSAPFLEPSGIQLTPPSFVSGSQSVDLVPLSPTLPTILATAPVSAPFSVPFQAPVAMPDARPTPGTAFPSGRFLSTSPSESAVQPQNV